MQQLPITPSVPQSASAASVPAAVSTTVGAETGDGLEGSPGVNFGAILGKQIKGLAAKLEQPGDLKADSSAELGEAVEFSAELAAPVSLQVDITALATSVQPAVTQRGADGAADLLSGQAETAKPILDLPAAGKSDLVAEIAGNGKILPQAVSADNSFADQLSLLIEGAGNKLEVPSSPDASPLSQPFAGLNNQTATMRQVEALPTQPVLPRVGSSEWGGAVGEKVLWMASQNHQVAELHLNPPSLGPLEVRLTVSNDQASALFVSHHSAVREAIETALPRLREMLADSGIMLGNATVSAESFNRQQTFDQESGKQRDNGGGAVELVVGPQGGMAVRGLARDGMVDIFA
jgi:flagellar hook-length control protein FliK